MTIKSLMIKSLSRYRISTLSSRKKNMFSLKLNPNADTFEYRLNINDKVDRLWNNVNTPTTAYNVFLNPLANTFIPTIVDGKKILCLKI